ncbi:MAG TPA: rhodanese-like domain-containing protein [Alphaproteobacteria bacterium]|nr:rhodanese-like domain-containing protein [Alphaproteobacteria bacterium]
MQQIGSLIDQYGVFIVFLPVLLGQAGLPIPVFPTLMIAAALGAGGGFHGAAYVFLAGMVGGLAADLGWFAASRWYGRRLLGFLCKVSFSPDSCVRQTETFYARLGGLSIALAKWVPGLGIVSIALAGMTEMSTGAFTLIDTIGQGLFVAAAVLLGILFKSAIFSVIATLTDLGGLGLAVALAALALYASARWWQRQAFIRQLRMDRISVTELADMIDRGDTPIIIDVRPHNVRVREGIIPGALFAHPADPEMSLPGFPRDVEIIVYCSCPNEASAAVAAQHLRRAGFRKIRPLLGGIDAWTEAGRQIAVVQAA